VAEAEETIEITKQAFLERGLEAAWERVIALVVQPGVEFGDTSLFEYNRDQARALSQFIQADDQLVYEAHSTDYQTAGALKHMVEDQFAILKVGPALTFAFREAIFALAMMEEELFAGKVGIELSRIRTKLEEVMLAQPIYWQNYYHGDPEDQCFARKYSFSDRSRYYWPATEVQASLAKLMKNLVVQPIPYSLLSQYLPIQYERIRNQELTNSPRALILNKIASVLADYAHACRYTNSKQG
jgi:D-tagatose-1,6-bisphosphate aldolase subunit GatZ/KbaZ